MKPSRDIPTLKNTLLICFLLWSTGVISIALRGAIVAFSSAKELYRFCVMTAHITYPWAPLTHLARRLLHVPDLVGRPDHTTGAACFALRSNTSSSQSNATWCCRLKLFTWRKASAPS